MVQQRGIETRARLLEVAVECFAESGYEATSVAEICRRTGVSKGAFYHHFAGKQALFLELFQHWLDQIDEQLQEARDSAQSVDEALRSMAGSARHVFTTAGDQLPMFLEFWTQAAHDPAVWHTIVAPYRRYHSLFAGLVRQGIAEGSLRPVDSELAARVIVSLAVGLVLQGLLDPEAADWGWTAEEGVQLLLQGLSREE